MGDSSDEADVTRFMRSVTGQGAMRKLRERLYGSLINDVSFHPETDAIRIQLGFQERAGLSVYLPELSLSVLRETHAEVLEAEYYKDFPDRRPKEDGP